MPDYQRVSVQRCSLYGVVLALLLVGCGGGGSSTLPSTTGGNGAPKAAPPQSLPNRLYVFEGLLPSNGTTQGEIDAFPAGSVGAAAPTRLVSTYLYPYGGALAFAPNGSLYATGYTDNGYLVVAYSPSQLNGGSDPKPIIYSYYYYIKHGGNANELLLIGSLAVDSKGDVFVVGEQNGGGGTMGVFEYPSGFAPATTPAKITTVAETSPDLVYVDSKNNLYVVNGSQTTPYSIFVYAAGSPLTGSPTRTIAGTNVGFKTVSSLAVTANGQLVVFDGVTDEVYVFNAGANGNATPQSVFQSGFLNWSSPMTVDANGNVYSSQAIFVSNTFQLEAFAGSSVGVVSPLFNVQSSNLYPTYLLFSH